jgi:protein disulfide isomerase
VFYKENDPQSQAYKDILTEASAQLKGKILMAYSQVEVDIGKRLGDFIGVTPAMVPTVRIVNPSAEKIVKFELPEDIKEVTVANLVAFQERYAAGTLTAAFKSEPVPESNDGPVKVIVRNNWEEIVRDSSKDVLVEFYAPWCGHCQKLTPILEELGKQLLSNPNIVIAKVDSTANDIDNVDVKGFPTIKFFPANAKDAPLDFDGERTQEGFVAYLKKHATVALFEA